MSYDVTLNDFGILKQGTQEVYLKVELCNRSMKVLDSLEGVIISDNFSQTCDSIQRRTYSCDMHVQNSSFSVGKDKKIWVDKRLRVYYGVKSLRTQEIKWYKIGTFVYVDIDYSFSSAESKVSLRCADMMAEYDGTINGQIGGYGSANAENEYINAGLMIPSGEDIRSSIIATLKDAKIENYIVEDIGKEVPYDLEFSTGATYADVWKQINDLYPGWEYFFDVDGTFIWRQISTCLDDPVVLDDTIMQKIVDVNGEQVNISFDGIYNVTEVLGKVLELTDEDRYTETSDYSNNTYNIHLDGYTSWDDIDHLTKIAFKTIDSNLEAPYFSVNSYNPIPIYDGDGKPLNEGVLKSNTTYVFRYRRLNVNEDGVSSALYLLGQFQAYGKYVETSLDCPFSVPNIGYEIMKSVAYESLSDDAACYNQAEYDTYTTTAMMDTITLTTLVIPWLEVNKKIEYTPQYNGVTNQYIIKSINWNTGNGTMTMTLYKFLESFSFVYNRKYGKAR